MKYLIISDDIGNPIYFDHPKGRMICLPMATAQDLLNEGFNEHFTSIQIQDCILVFHQSGFMRMLAVSDHGESEDYLRWQLNLVENLLLMRYGPKVTQEKRHTNFLRLQQYLQCIFDTMHHLSLRRQSFLVGGIERLEISEDIRTSVVKQCVDSFVVKFGFPSITHVIILVGTTKLLVLYPCQHPSRLNLGSRDPAPEISAYDLNLMAILCRAHFKPAYREVYRDQLPVADYTDHAAVFSHSHKTTSAQEQSSTGEEEFLSANEEFSQSDDLGGMTEPDIPDKDLYSEDEQDDARKRDALDPTSDPLQLDSNHADDLSSEASSASSSSTSLASTTTSSSAVISGTGSHSAPLGLASTPATPAPSAASSASASASHVSFAPSPAIALKPSFARPPEPSLIPVSASAPTLTSALLDSKVGRAVTSALPSAVSTAAVPVLPVLSLSQSLATFSRTIPLHESIYLKVGSQPKQCFIHGYSLDSSLTLVIITKGKPASPEVKTQEYEKLDKIHVGLRKALIPYSPYFTTQHRTHLVANLTKFVHKLPGLIHFIFVDRFTERVVAPSITPLEGKKFEGADESAKSKIALLKKKVWQMVFCGQRALTQGYSSMIMTAGEFQYVYRVWFVDENQVELPLADIPLTKGLKPPKIQLSNTFYKDLAKRLYGSNRRVRCFELYTLYVAGISAATVNSHNTALVAQLLH